MSNPLSMFSTKVRTRIRNFLGSPVGCRSSDHAGGGIVEREIAQHPVVRYLVYEVLEMRKLLRYLAADKINDLPFVRAQTLDSFNYQWGHFNQGEWMLEGEKFRKEGLKRLCRFTEKSPEWFRGKKILDAGCGSGRWSYLMCSLGAQVTAIDMSEHGITATKAACTRFDPSIVVFRHNLLEEIPLSPDFDLVWSYGVLHHTGNTYGAFRNISRLVKPGGHIFLMLYNEPTFEDLGGFAYYAETARLRKMLRNKPFETRIEIIRRERPNEDAHGWFDAVSPEINDTYGMDEIETWLIEAGFEDIRRTVDLPTHHVIARRKAGV